MKYLTVSTFVLLQAIGAGAALPIAVSPDEVPAGGPPRGGIFVPGPTRGATATNAVAEATNTPAPDRLAQPAVFRGWPRMGGSRWRVAEPEQATCDAIAPDGLEEIPGSLLKWTESTIHWTIPAARQPVRFQNSLHGTLRLAPATGVAIPEPPRWVVRLINGDILTGDALTLDAAQIELTSPAVGRLRVARERVAAVQQALPQGTNRFRAVHRLADWGRVIPDERDTSMAHLSMLYRDANLPDVVAIDMPVCVAAGQMFTLYLFAGHPMKPRDLPMYVVELTGNTLRLGVRRGLMNDEDSEYRALQEWQWLNEMRDRYLVVNLGIRVNRKSGRIVLLADGEVIINRLFAPLPDACERGLWVGGSIPGRSMMYTGAKGGLPLPDRLVISPLADDLDPLFVTDRDRVRLAGGPPLACSLDGIGREMLEIAGKEGRQKVPLDRLVCAQLAFVMPGLPKRLEGQVTVCLRDGAELTGQQVEINASSLTMDSEWAGQIALPRAAVAGIKWGRERLAAPPTGTAWSPGRILLLDGTQLTGGLAGFTEESVCWNLPAVREPVELRREQVLRLVTSLPHLNPNPAPCSVQLANGDRLSGHLMGVDEQNVRMRLAFTQTVSVARSSACSLRPGATAEGVIDTVGSPQWQSPGNSISVTVGNQMLGFRGWSEVNYSGSQPYSRKGDYPDRLAMQFVLAREGRMGELTAVVNGAESFQGGCRLTVNETGVSLAEGQGGGALRYALYSGSKPAERGYTQSQQFEDGDWRTLAMSFLVDRKRGEMLLLADGRPVRRWAKGVYDQSGLRWEPDDGEVWSSGRPFAAGSWIWFRENRVGTARQLRNVVISEWRGDLDLITNPAPRGVDSVWLHDMSRQTGSLVRVENNRAILEYADGRTNMPLGFVAWIDFREAAGERGADAPGNVRVYLPDGDQLTLSSVRFSRAGLTGKALGIGFLTVPTNVIVRVDFSPREMELFPWQNASPAIPTNAAVSAAQAEKKDIGEKGEQDAQDQATWAPFVPPPPTSDTIRFYGNEDVAGWFLGWDGSNVLWNLPVARQPVRFDCGEIKSLKFSPRPGEKTPAVAPPRWLVRLNNGDVLVGDGLTLDAAQVELTTPLAGRVKLRRNAILSVHQDPDAPDGRFRAFHWLGDWDRLDSRRIYGEVDLPAQATVELPLTFNPPPYLTLTFYAVSPTNPGARWRLNQWQPTAVTIRDTSLRVQSMVGGSQEVSLKPALFRTWVDLGFRLDRDSERMDVMVDGEVKNTLSIPWSTIGDGRGIMIRNEQQPAQPVEDIQRWLLLTPVTGGWAENRAAPDLDRIQFANGDVVCGSCVQIGAREFVITGKLGRLSLPLERLASATLAAAGRTGAQRGKMDAGVGLCSGEQLSGALVALNDKQVALNTDWGGKITVARTAVAELRWGQGTTRPVTQATQQPFMWFPGTLEFIHGQRLRGSLEGFTAQDLFWRHPAAPEPLTLRRDLVARVTTLLPALSSNPPPAIVRFSNGDRLSGRLSGADGQNVQLEPPDMQPFRLARQVVSSLSPGSDPADVLDTGGNTNWIVSGRGVDATNRVVRFQRNAYGGSYARRGQLPERICLQFELANEEPYLSGMLRAFARATQIDWQDPACTLRVLGGCATVRNMGKDQDASSYAAAVLNAPPDQSSLSLAWLIDRKRGESQLLVNGVLAMDWKAKSGIPSGNVVRLESQNSLPCRYSRIVLSEWRGSGNLFSEAAPIGADRVLLHDMTALTGVVSRISEGALDLTGAGISTNVPLGRVAWVEFRPAGGKPAGLQPGDVRVNLPDGDRLTFSSAVCDRNGLSGKVAGLGVVTVPASAIVRVDFMPRSPERSVAP